MDKVSVIIPAYNSSKYISLCLNSVISQNYNNIEIIVVDDGSEDNTIAKVNEIIDKNPEKEIHLINQKNYGAGVARNKGIELSKGAYIQFLDADDVISNNKIYNQLRCNDNDKYTVLSCSWDRFTNNISEASFPNRILFKDYKAPCNWFKDAWLYDDMMVSHAWLISRELIEKAGYWNEHLKINQDGEFMSRVLINAEKIKFVPDAKAYYRSKIDGSITNAYLSLTKAKSLLASYKLYVSNLYDLLNDLELRMALARNFLGFIYQYHPYFPELIAEAKKQIEKLNVDHIPLVGGNNFKRIASIIGFENALKTRSIFKSKLIESKD